MCECDKQRTRIYIDWDFLLLVITVFICILALAIAGCAPAPASHKRPTLADTKIQPQAIVEAPPSVPHPVVWQPIPEQISAPVRIEKPDRAVRVMSAGGKIIVYEPGKKYPLYCPEFGALSVLLPQGETIQAINSGNSGEWMIEKTVTGIDLPIPVIAIRRAPYAAPSELHVITDAAIYQFILHPQFKRVSQGQQSLVVMVNTDTEARRRERELARAEAIERRRREAAERAAVPFDYVRAYRLGSQSGEILTEEGAN